MAPPGAAAVQRAGEWVHGAQMEIAITGSTGLIGERLVRDLRGSGHHVRRLVRGNPAGDDIRWKPGGALDPAALRGVDAVVHLAGHPIGRRWTAAERRRVLDSRVEGTRTIAEAVARADGGPQTLVVASGINVYPDAGDQVLTEDSPHGDGFLAQVVEAWEAAADPARDAGVRTVHTRFGIVLSREGGALAKLLPLFRMGLGGRFGSGRQWWSWVSLDDVSGVVRWALEQDGAQGAYNVTAPNPVTNEEFTEVLAEVLHRPAVIPVPAFAPRLLLGEVADVLLFDSLRVEPARLLEEGYTFELRQLGPALRRALGR
jgi:uncharacterized protein